MSFAWLNRKFKNGYVMSSQAAASLNFACSCVKRNQALEQSLIDIRLSF